MRRWRAGKAAAGWRAPWWAWLLSWAFWLALLGGAAAAAAQRIAVHDAEMESGRIFFSVRYRLCRHAAQPPRPSSAVCAERASDERTADILAPGPARRIGPDAPAPAGL
jgi:hypothetical protein